MAGLFLSFVFRKFSLPFFGGVGGRTGISNHLIGQFLHLSMCHCLATSFFLFACFPFCLDLSGRVTLKWTVGRSWRNGCVGKLAEQTHHPISKSGAFLCVCVSLAFFFSFPRRSIQLSIFVPVFSPMGSMGCGREARALFSSLLLHYFTRVPRRTRKTHCRGSSASRVDAELMGKSFPIDHKRLRSVEGSARFRPPFFPPIFFHWEWRHYISCNFFFLCCPFVEMYWKESRAEYDVISIGPISPRNLTYR